MTRLPRAPPPVAAAGGRASLAERQAAPYRDRPATRRTPATLPPGHSFGTDHSVSARIRSIGVPWVVTALAFASVTLLVSCDPGRVVQIGPEDVVLVRMSPDSADLPIGHTLQLHVLPLDATGALLVGLAVDWTSGNASVATVDAAGLVTGVGAGSAQIVATVAGVSATAELQVAPPAVIALSRDSVGFVAAAGGADPSPDSVDVTNAGFFPLVGLAVDSIVYDAGASGWLAAALDSVGAPATLALTPSTGAVTTAGTYAATVWISGLDADNSPASVRVTLRVTGGAPADVTINDGDGQSAVVGSAVATAPSVLVTDAFGNPVQGVTVAFAITGGGGSLTAASPVTNASGVARVGSWTLGTTAGANALGATVSGVAPVTFGATGTPGPVDGLAVSGGDNQSAVAGFEVAVAPSVVAIDAFGNGVSGVPVTFEVESGGGSITGASAVTAADGTAFVGSWTLGASAGPNTLITTSTAVADTVTFSASGLSGDAVGLEYVDGDAQTDTVAATLPVAYAVRVVDTNGNGVSGVQVSWSVTGGGGSIPMSSTTDVDGVATAARVLGTTAGPQTARGAVGGLIGSPVAFTATAVAGAPATIALDAGGGQSATVNTAVATPPRVVVRDQFTNPIVGLDVTFQVTAGGGVVSPVTPVATAADGTAGASSWTLGTAAGVNNNTVTAQAAGGGIALAINATATADVPASIELASGEGQTAITGSNLTNMPTARVRDQFMNVVPNVTVDFVASGTGSVGSASAVTNGSGLAATTWTVRTAGASMGPTGAFANTLTATVQGTAISTAFTGSAIYSYAQHIDPKWSLGCTGCHGGASGLTFPGTVAGNYAAVVDVVPFCDGGLPAAVRLVSSAGGVDAADSLSVLMRMVDAPLPLIGGCNTKMPPPGAWPATRADTIRAWIRNGAPNND